MSNAFVSRIEKLFLCLLLFLGSSNGRITAPVCALNNCIPQDSKGRWCYLPDPSTSGGTVDCPGTPNKTPDMTAVIAVHIKQGLSLAYYNAVDNARLGGANYTIPPGSGKVVFCASGVSGGGAFQTQCLTTGQDNDLWPYLGSECIVAVAQDFVSDGCYTPKSGVVLTDDPSTSTLGLTSSSLLSSTISTTQSLHVITPTLTTLVEPTIATIVTNGATQTIVVVPLNAPSSGSSQSKGVVLPIVLTLFVVILVGLGVFVWWYKKRARERKFSSPPPFDQDVGDGRSVGHDMKDWRVGRQ
ncbi:hypothetical protein GALMADRAFT_105181 [Galerina marginata CBS 339.88]|uniref:Uncharacterized protein n=1 Tax=Galerina marginata (strain CBS 339.88) TaxID=685588 RepID=A0A067SDM5_GALM3|nr:hypothetical protein GALMADRAFT_105181 [Galerina marginata CBS 339.88]